MLTEAVAEMNDEDYRWVSIHDLRRCWANQLVVADRISPRTVIAFLLMGNGTVMSRQKAVLVGLLLILTVVFTASGFARAPPHTACGICTDALDRAAAEHRVTLTRGQSKLAIRVSENTLTRWTATVQLTDGAAALQNDSLWQSSFRMSLIVSLL
ncbi:hypothetical protein ACFQJ8_27060 [Halocatena marina]|uniref:hypothetical protein n=1 Tax=Halocatena marina TaxID=2934937 RepID=UPI003609A2D9